MRVHLVDGTYELFRHHFALPSHRDDSGREVAATRGVIASLVGMLEGGATHVGVATDHVIESFRNDLWEGYKTSAGMEAVLLEQFGLFEDVLAALGVAVWAMTGQEADDALAAAAAVATADRRVETVYVCTPDKDLGQIVSGHRVVQLDRRRNEVRDADGVRAKFGVTPVSIPDWLALVGDAADGFPGIAGWGAKSAAVVLARYSHLEAIPVDPTEWDVTVRGASRLAASLHDGWESALLFRRLATLRTDASVGEVDDWEWRGPAPEFSAWCDRLGAPEMALRASRLAARRRSS